METHFKEYIQTFYELFHNKKWESFAQQLHENFTYFTDGCIVQNKSQFVKFLANDNTWIGKSYSVENIKVHFNENEKIAFCTYQTEFVGADNGQQLIVKAIETAILSKENNEWKILHFHTSNKMNKVS